MTIGLHNLSPKPGSIHRKKRLGTGSGSGHGQTCTRGQKGQNSTSGGSKPDGFEGGQMPLLRRIPKSGFRNTRFANKFDWINVGQLEKFAAGTEVTAESLKEKGMVSGNFPVKLLGDGELTKSLKISLHAASKSAVEKVNKAGGNLTLTGNKKPGDDKSR